MDARSAERSQKDIDAIKDDIAALKNDLREIAASYVSHGRDSARAMRDNVQHRVDSSLSAVEEAIEQRPISSMLLIFGAGVLAGMLVRRK